GMPLVTMFASNRCSRSNPTEVFERDCLARCDGFLNQLLANTVIGVTLETGLAAAHLPQTAFGVLRTDLLQSLAAQIIAATDDGNNLPGEVLALAVGGQVHDAQESRRQGIARAQLLLHGDTDHRVSPNCQESSH